MQRAKRGRKKPYLEIGIRRVTCFRCKKRKSKQQWNICADGNVFRAICFHCDVELNDTVLEFMGFENRVELMVAYCSSLRKKYGDEFDEEWQAEGDHSPYSEGK